MDKTSWAYSSQYMIWIPLQCHNPEEVLPSFHSLLNIYKWTRLLGHAVHDMDTGCSASAIRDSYDPDQPKVSLECGLYIQEVSF